MEHPSKGTHHDELTHGTPIAPGELRSPAKCSLVPQDRAKMEYPSKGTHHDELTRSIRFNPAELRSLRVWDRHGYSALRPIRRMSRE